MKFLRWITCFPIGALAGLLVSGACLAIGDAVFGGWKLTSGIVIYVSALWLPLVSTMTSLQIAPRRDRFAKWLLLTPYLLGALFCLPILFSLLFAPEAFGDVSSTTNLSRSLSGRAQMMIWNLGYLVGVLGIASEDITQLRPETESKEASRFRRAFGRAVTSRRPEEQIAAVQEGLEALKPLEAWPFEPPMLKSGCHPP